MLYLFSCAIIPVCCVWLILVCFCDLYILYVSSCVVIPTPVCLLCSVHLCALCIARYLFGAMYVCFIFVFRVLLILALCEAYSCVFPVFRAFLEKDVRNVVGGSEGWWR